MNTAIHQALRGLEEHHNVTILLAVEAGSRAWGFQSPDSDYDVRFVYVRPIEDYLSVRERRDVIEGLPPQVAQDLEGADLLDCSGWDLKKALGLLAKGNPPLFEWLFSSITYRPNLEERGQSPALELLHKQAIDHWSPRAAAYHYYHMARRNWQEYLQRDEVWTKKYLYVLRPVLAVEHMRQRDWAQGMPPVWFNTLAEQVEMESPVREAIQELIQRKKEGDELSHGPPIPILHEYLADHMKFLATCPAQAPKTEAQMQSLDTLFREILFRTAAEQLVEHRTASNKEADEDYKQFTEFLGSALIGKVHTP